MPGHSCMMQLLVVIEEWVDILEEGYPMDVIYLDFKKAFNSVSHPRLLRKLQTYGIEAKILTWISSFFDWKKTKDCV